MSVVFAWVVALMAKSSAILLLALGFDWALRRAPAQTRHALWTASFVALLALPILTLVLPTLPVPGLPVLEAGVAERHPVATNLPAPEPVAKQAERTAVADVQTVSADGRATAYSDESRFADTRRSRAAAALVGLVAQAERAGDWLVNSSETAVLIVWSAGTALALLFVFLAFRRAASLMARAGDLLDVAWRTDLRNSRALLGMRENVRLRTSTCVGTPMAGGLLRSVVLVPELARRWSAERRRFVLLHELVHVAHWDPVRHLIARLALAMHWPNPLAWLAAHRAMSAREEACDETVLALGARPSSYARELLHLHDALQPANTAAIAALPMVQRSLMEKRLMNILRKDRRPLRRQTAVALAVFASITTLSVAAAAPQEPDKVKVTVKPKVEVQVKDKVHIKVAPVVKTESRLEMKVNSQVKVRPNVKVDVQDAPRVVVKQRPVIRVRSDIQSEAVVPTAAPRADSTAAIASPAAVPAPQPAAVATPSGVPVVLPALYTWTGIVPQADAPATSVVPTLPGVPVPALAPAPSAQRGRHDACAIDASADTRGRNSNGRYNYSSVHHSDGELACMRTYGAVELDEDTGRVIDMGPDAVIVYETRNDAGRRWLEVRAGNDYTWQVDGEERPFDEAAREWYSAIQDVVSTRWQISRVRGEVATKRGEIATIRGEAATIRGQMATARGQVATMRGEIATIHGRHATARGEVATARGRAATIRGRMATHAGTMNALRAQRRYATDEELVHIDALMEAAERRVEEMRAQLVEAQRAAELEAAEVQEQSGDVEAEVAEVQERIAAYELEERLAALDREVEALQVQENIERVEAEIAAMRVDEVMAEIERQLAPALERLERASSRTR
ncbi:MAG: hypothetical protein GKS06_08110 [Acidobacteria bacterium]|nr:hypothetical protein [Acidobacteriota bacterium]